MFCSKQVMIGASKNIWGFDPRSVGGCSLWLDPADTSTVTLNGSTVSQLNDKSGLGYNMSQATSGNQPTYSTALNGNRILTFTQASSTRLSNVSFPAFIGSGPASYFLVEYNMSAPAGSNPSPFGYSAGPNFGLIMQYNLGFTGGLQPFSTGVTSFTSTRPRLIFLHKPNVTSSNMTGFINGTSQTVSDTTSGTYSGTFSVGSGTNGFISGNICELIVFNTNLTTSQRQQVEGYLTDKWGLTAYYSPTTPLSIPGCQLWLDGADSSTVTVTNGTVTNVMNKGNTSITLSNASGFTYDSTNMAFSNATSNASFNLGKNSTYTQTQPGTLFAVAAFSSAVSNPYIIDSRSTQVDVGRFAYSIIRNAANTANVAYAFAGNAVQPDYGLRTQSDIAPNIRTLHTLLMNSTSSDVRINGITQTWSQNPGTNSMTGITVANRYSDDQSWVGTINEILLFNRGLTLAERQQIEEYLSKKWRLTTIYPTLPITHPYYSLKPCLRTFQPTDIAGCRLWLDGADLSSMTFSGSTITQWNDKSANGNNATIAAGKIGATFSSVSNSVYFQASNVGYQTSYSANPTNETMFVVFNNPSPSLNNNILIGGQQGARSLGAGYSGSGGNTVGVVGNLNNEVVWLARTAGGTYTSGTTVLVTSQFTTSTNTISLNGGTAASGGAPGFYANTTTYLGVDTTTTAYYYIGYAMEIIFYNSLLSTSQRQQIEGYLAQKWGLTSSLPATHLFKTFPLATVTRPNFKELAYTGNDFNAYFAKYSPDGSVLWALRWVSTGGITFNDSATDSSGNVYVTGLYVNSSLLMYDTKGLLVKTLANSGGYDGFVAKYSSSGILLWTARHVGPGNNGYPTGVAVDSSGNVYAGGTWDGASVTLFSADEASSNTFGTTGGQTDGYIVKYNSSGIVQWSAKVVCTSYDQGGMSLKTDSSGNVYSVGINVLAAPTFYNANGTVGGSLLWGGTSEGMWLAKWNSSGTFQWALRFVTGDLNTGAGALSIDSSGNLYVSSAYDSTLTLKNTGDATAATMTNSGSYDAFIVKYSSAGSYIWNARIGGTGSTQEIANAIDGSGNVYVMGLYTGTLIVYTSGEASNTTLTNSGSYDHFIAKYTSAGVLVWATRIGSSGSEYNKGISVDLAGNVYTHGGHSATVTFFNVGGGIGGTLSNVGVDGYLAKYTTNGTFVWAALFGGPVTELSMRSITDPEGNIYLGGIYNSSPLTLNGV